MPRTKRVKSNTNVYHIMSRALNRELLFDDEGDYLRYITLLNKAKKAFNLKIYAYCLMTNHVHLLMKGNLDDISRAMKWLNSSYALFFNAKNGRLGYVFADRFRSECIETLEYFKKCIRYIHQNPVKAMICENINRYKFSSIHAYKNVKSNYLNLIDVKAVINKFGKNDFIEWNKMENHDLCMDYLNNRFSDKELRNILYKLLNVSKISDYDKLSEAEKAYGALKLIDMYVPLRQISRVTGIYYNKVQKLRLGLEGKVTSLIYTEH